MATKRAKGVVAGRGEPKTPGAGAGKTEKRVDPEPESSERARSAGRRAGGGDAEGLLEPCALWVRVPGGGDGRRQGAQAGSEP